MSKGEKGETLSLFAGVAGPRKPSAAARTLSMFDKKDVAPVFVDRRLTQLRDPLLEWVPKPAASVAAAVERAAKLTRRKLRTTAKTKAKPKRGPVGREAVRVALQRCADRLKACDCGKKK